MAGDLHEISANIGELRATSVEQTRQLGAMWTRMDEIKELLIRNSATHATQEQRIKVIEKKFEDDVDPAILELAALRNKGIGLIAAVGFIASLIGLKAGAVATWIMGSSK